MVRPPYQTAARLSGTAAVNWVSIDGTYSGQGVNILRLPFHRFLNVIYAWCAERVSEDDRERWLVELETPLPDQRGHSEEAEAQAELDQLKNLM